MFAKNDALPPRPTVQPLIAEHQKPSSLRLRLVLWYGLLVAVALSFFAVLVLTLTTDELNQSVDNAVRAEARIAEVALSRELTPTPPHWPVQLVLRAVDRYQEPGVAIEIDDLQGTLRYDSDGNSDTRIPVSAATMQMTYAGQTPWYTTHADGVRLRVEALPIRASQTLSSGGTADTGAVIGILLIAKSFGEVDATLHLLQILLLLSGTATVVGTLIGGWVIAARVLRPLAEIAKTAKTIAATTVQGTQIGNLSQRVRRPAGRDEMTQVVDTLNEMLTNLDRATQGQRRFVADASHELRAPLTTIQGNLAFLQRHGDALPSEERRTMLADAHEETLRLAQLVEELLLLARADAKTDQSLAVPGQRTTAGGKSQQPVELDRVVLHTVRQMRGRLRAENATLTLDLGHIEPIRVDGEEESLRRVVLILLDNALKYTTASEHGETGHVTISVERSENEAVVRVHDTGMGIDPTDLPHIFERFYRADRARTRKGTGLGLAIAQTLVTQLGGHITAESTVGQGSMFSVWLPLAAKK